MRWLCIVAMSALLMACGDDMGGSDGGDGGGDRADSGGDRIDSGGADSDGGGDVDSGGGDSDGGGGDMDGGGDRDAGPRPDGSVACTDDAQCTSGAEWCEGGICVPCDNSGLLCDIACSPAGWDTYTRNGCSPCECGPPPGCRSDAECADAGGTCYPGRFCWCDPSRPECCLGNFCGTAGCTPPSPAGCRNTGCARGQSCVVAPGMCVPSRCSCDGSSGNWGCTEDCGGGSCM